MTLHRFRVTPFAGFLLGIALGFPVVRPALGLDQPVTSSPEPRVKILDQNPGCLEVEVLFPALTSRPAAAGSELSMGKLPCVPDAAGYLLPGYQTLLPGRPGAVSLKVLEVQTAALALDKPPEMVSVDQVNTIAPSENPELRRAGRNTDAGPGDWAQVKYLGRYRGLPLSAVEFRPVRWNPKRRQALYLKSARVRVEFLSEAAQPGQRRAVMPPELRSLALSSAVSASTGPQPSQPLTTTATGPRLKIYLSKEGLYHLTSGDLAAWGLDLSNVDPRTLRMEHFGQEIPIYVGGEADGRFDPGDYIEFWGETLHGTYTAQNPEIYSDLYTDANVYWLSWGGPLGARLGEESGEVVEVREAHQFHAVSYPYFIHQEQNSYYNRLSHVSQDSLKEHWFYDSGVRASQTHTYNVYMPYPDINALTGARVRINLQGLTYPDELNQGGQHHVYVSLDNQNSPALEGGSSGASWWVGQTGIILDTQGTFGISATALHHGNNQVALFSPVDTYAGLNDTMLLNWFEITYQRLYKADGDMIRFAAPQAATPDTIVDYRIDGFTTSQIDIYKLGQSKIINAEVIPYQAGGQTRYKVRFQDQPYGQPQYVALAPSAKLLPDSASVDQGSDIHGQLASGSPVKLLVIAHRSFEGNPDLQNYLARRNAQLGRTELVYIDDVFDEYSNGLYSPQAIKDLLLSMPQPPENLLLLGDASYDTRNLYGQGGNLVPAQYIQTMAYGVVASDFWYSLLDDDQIPDLAVGRISARTNEELSDYFQKLEEYETTPESGKWHSTHLFVSGTGGVEGTTFLAKSQEIIGLAPDNVMIERLATDPISSPFYGGTTDLIDFFDAGALIVNYNGHGAGAVWSDNSLFRIEDLPQLSNQGRYPFITNFTCFIGAFDTPEQGTILGESFIFEPEKGAIAVLGSTGLGWFLNGALLQEQLVHTTYMQPGLTLGDLINVSKIAYYNYYHWFWGEQSFDTIHLMNLLGDPTLVLAHANQTQPAQATPEFVQTGDSIHVNLPGNYSGYTGKLRVYDDNDYPSLQFGQPFEVPVIASGNGLQANFMLPAISDSLNPTEGTFRLSYWDPAGDVNCRTAASFFMLSAYGDSTGVDSLTPYPYPLYANVPVGIRARLLNSQGVASAWAHFRLETDSTTLVEDDSLVMNPMPQEHWYQTAAAIDSSLYHYNPGDHLIIWVKVTSAGGDTFTSTYSSPYYFEDGRASVGWVANSLHMGMKQNQAALIVQLRNSGQATADSLDVDFYRLNPGPQLLGTTIIHNLKVDSTAEAWIPSNLLPGPCQFEIHKNDSGWVNQTLPDTLYPGTLTVDHVSLTSAGTGDTLSVADSFRVFIPAGSLTLPSGVMTLRPRTDLAISPGQQGLSFAAQDTSGGYGLEVGFLGGLALTGDSMYIEAKFPSDPDLALHVQETGQTTWRKLTTADDTLHLYYWTKSHSAGSYSLMQNGDHQGPRIEITVEGQTYTDSGFIPTQPKISALVQDQGGVSLTPGSYWVSVDNQALDSNLVSVNPGGDGQTLTLSINPTFATGQHTVRVDARDLSGNMGSASIVFQVAGQFSLGFLGNYPNPIKDKTYFAYSLSEQTTEPVQIRIYTVSGRLIRTLYSGSADEINYGEVYWDGRDEDGAMIANGVYFYKFTARRGDDKIERTMKLAILR